MGLVRYYQIFLLWGRDLHRWFWSILVVYNVWILLLKKIFKKKRKRKKVKHKKLCVCSASFWAKCWKESLASCIMPSSDVDFKKRRRRAWASCDYYYLKRHKAKGWGLIWTPNYFPHLYLPGACLAPTLCGIVSIILHILNFLF